MNETTAARSYRYDSHIDAEASTPHDGIKHSLRAYVSDILALERRVREPIVRQSEDAAAADFPEAMHVIARHEMLTDVHIEALKAKLAELGDAAGNSVTDSAASVSQSLRDDYVALSLVAVHYTMLHTVALAFGDRSTAELAQRHNADITILITEIARILPSVVLQELRAEGVSISPEVRRSALLHTHDAWSDSGT